MKDFIANFAAVVGAATLALLLFAVCHEYGYLDELALLSEPAPKHSPDLRSGGANHIYFWASL
jgi:hypothetical protein